MPRPRRTKVASSNPRVATSPDDKPISTCVISTADDTMAPKNTRKGRPAKAQPVEEQDPIESTDPKQEKQPAKSATRPRGRPAKKIKASEDQSRAWDALKARRDAAMKAKIAGTYSVAKSAAQAVSSSSAKEALTAAHEGLSASTQVEAPRVVSTPTSHLAAISKGRTPSHQTSTDEDLYGLSPGGKAAQERVEARRLSTQQAPPSAPRAHGTPAMETSILALANFKRRPRQNSIIRMIQQTSELGHEDEDLDLEDTLRDFDDFNPEDESTPLNLGKRNSDVQSPSKLRSAQAVDALHTSSSRKRKHDDLEDEVQVPASSPLASSPPRLHHSNSPPQRSRSSSLPEDDILESTERPITEGDPPPQSDTMAPPCSSSEPASPALESSRPDKRQKTPRSRAIKKTITEKSTRKEATTKPNHKAPKISTAHLQSLLPKPRQKQRAAKRTDAYDVPSSGDLGVDTSYDIPSDDDDELSRPIQRRRATSIATKTPLRKVDGNKSKLRKPTVSPASARKSLAVSTKRKAKQKRTYGRQVDVEKENEDSILIPSDHSSDEEDGTGIGVAKAKGVKSKELEAVRDKFKEIDEWEMEFESVDLGGGGSSPWR